MFDKFDKQHKMKTDWNTFLRQLQQGEFDSYEQQAQTFLNVMIHKKFMPNTPAIANFGNVLGMGSACFHPNQIILTESGPKKISEIKAGKKVLTHLGRYRPVTEVFIRNTDKLFEINCHKLPKSTLQVTEEHPILSLENGETKWKAVSQLTKGSLVAVSFPMETKDVSELTITDFVAGLTVNSNDECYYSYEGGKFNAFKHETKSVKNHAALDFDLMRLFGYYLAEGTISNQNCVRFTFSSDEIDLCQDTIFLMENKFGISARIEHNSNENRKWVSLRFHSTILAQFFDSIFGTGFNKKIIPAWMLTLPAEKQKGLIIGIGRGDGTSLQNGIGWNTRIVMSNQNLVYGVWQMAMRAGLFCGLGKESMPKLATTQPYRCIIGSDGNELISAISGNSVQAVQTTRIRSKQLNGITFTPIDEIKEVPYNGQVFNLEVEEDHSYVAEGVAVHNCFVMDVEDNIEGIMDTLKNAAIVFKSGGGVGYNFSKLRPEGDYVSSTSGIASGPLTFMTLFDKMTEVIKQGGIRRGANMGILNSNHPDIEKFVTSKEGNKQLTNFNISILIMPDFWEHYHKNEPYPLLNPRSGEVVRTVNPRMLFDLIVYQAWESAEPGVIFFDRVNKYNPFTEDLGPIVTTNPCVTGDTLVSTENGLERIDSMQTRTIVTDQRALQNTNSLHTQTIQNGTQLAKATQVIKTGTKETLLLETTSGYELKATSDHRVLTSTGWKPIEQLTTNDSILIQSGTGQFNKHSALPFEPQNTITGKNGRSYQLGLPTEWSQELGLVMGWITGDGWLNTKYNQVGLVFSKPDSEAQQLIQPIFEQYCNRSISIANADQSAVQIRSNSRFVTDFFAKLGVKSVNEEKEVPKTLFTATEDAVTGFLKGLFSSDGTLAAGNESRNYARLNSSSLKLLKDTQLLLLNLGIKSTIYDRSTKPKQFHYTTANNETKEYFTSGTNFELNISKDNLARFLEKIGFIQSRHNQTADKIKQHEFYSEYFIEKIKSITPIGLHEVWDITEPVSHSFIANGIVTHNCGEVLLYPNESCNLGSINVWAFFKEDEHGNQYFDWEDLRQTIHTCTRLLDNVIDVNKFPLKAIEDMTDATRKIGLGVMGVADLLYELKLPYNSKEARDQMEKLMEFVNYYSKVESVELARKRGPIPYYDKSFYPRGKLPISGPENKTECQFDWDELRAQIKEHGIRNGYTTVIAPTGSISMIAGCSSGIEPVYSLVFEKNVKVGSFYYVDPVFERIMKQDGLYDSALMEDITANGGRAANIPYLTPEHKRVFVTAMDISPEDHIRTLAAFQKWTDSSISKTNNFPADATVEDMRESYILAYELGCKDVTVYRDNSIKSQVLNAPKKKEATVSVQSTTAKAAPMEQTANTSPQQSLAHTQTGGKQVMELKHTAPTHAPMAQMPGKNEITNCPNCSMKLAVKEGCASCPECGWGFCN